MADVEIQERTELGEQVAESVRDDNRPIYPEDIMEEQDLQLHTARYYVHKLRIKEFGDMVRQGMPEAQGEMMYRMAMLNYDELMKDSVNGQIQDANQASMDEGFKI